MSIDKEFPSGERQSDAPFATDRRILVVDDDEDIRLFLADRLEHLGFLTCLASNGMEGLTLLRERSFCGVLLDLEMPVLDGLTMLNQLRQESHAVPVIVMSAHQTHTTMIKAIEAGAKDFLTKPIADVILKYKCLRLFS